MWNKAKLHRLHYLSFLDFSIDLKQNSNLHIFMPMCLNLSLAHISKKKTFFYYFFNSCLLMKIFKTRKNTEKKSFL